MSSSFTSVLLINVNENINCYSCRNYTSFITCNLGWWWTQEFMTNWQSLWVCGPRVVLLILFVKYVLCIIQISQIYFILFIYIWPCSWHTEIPRSGIEPVSQQWQSGSLTARSPGKSSKIYTKPMHTYVQAASSYTPHPYAESWLLNIYQHTTALITFTNINQRSLPWEPQGGSYLIQRQSYPIYCMMCFLSKEPISDSILYLLFCLTQSLYSASADRCWVDSIQLSVGIHRGLVSGAPSDTQNLRMLRSFI